MTLVYNTLIYTDCSIIILDLISTYIILWLVLDEIFDVTGSYLY